MQANRGRENGPGYLSERDSNVIRPSARDRDFEVRSVVLENARSVHVAMMGDRGVSIDGQCLEVRL